jgi:hypothetical protein
MIIILKQALLADSWSKPSFVRGSNGGMAAIASDRLLSD